LGGDYNPGTSDFTGGIVNFNVPTTLTGIVNLGGTTVSGPGDITLNGPLNWSSGTITGAATVTANGGMNFSSVNVHDFNVNRVITNTGAAVWTDNGQIRTGSGGVFNNTSTATFDIRGDSAFNTAFGGAGSFNNAGSITKSAGSGATSFFTTVNHTGTISATSGTLSFAGLNWSAGTIGGTAPIETGGPFAISNSVSKIGPNTLTVSGIQNHAAGAVLNVAEGKLKLDSNAGAAANFSNAARANLTVAIGGTSDVVLGADQHLRNIDIDTSAAGAQSLDLSSPTGLLQARRLHIYPADIASAKASLYAAIVNANVAGAADPTDGIYDSNLHANAKIGMAQLIDAHGDSYILIRPTRPGDLNLDGTVTIADFLALAAKFGSPGTWQDGDINYDNTVTIADFLQLAGNFNSSYSGETWPIAPEENALLASFASSIGAAAVPEPASLTLLLGSALLLRRRRGSKL
jgi:hypothetical protein